MGQMEHVVRCLLELGSGHGDRWILPDVNAEARRGRDSGATPTDRGELVGAGPALPRAALFSCGSESHPLLNLDVLGKPIGIWNTTRIEGASLLVCSRDDHRHLNLPR